MHNIHKTEIIYRSKDATQHCWSPVSCVPNMWGREAASCHEGKHERGIHCWRNNHAGGSARRPHRACCWWVWLPLVLLLMVILETFLFYFFPSSCPCSCSSCSCYSCCSSVCVPFLPPPLLIYVRSLLLLLQVP